MPDEFTYEVPDAKAFFHTLCAYLSEIGKENVATLIKDGTCNIVATSNYSRVRWNALWTTIVFYVPVKRINQFTEGIKKQLHDAADMVMPKNAGFDIMDIQIAPLLQSPPDENGSLNNGTLVSDGRIKQDGLRFRSRPEVRIYEALKRHNVLFFVNATAVLGTKDEKREPDFLVCQNGKWGILEVMGNQYHPNATATRDHNRARLFKDYGLYYIEFYDAARCYNDPEKVVDDFLSRLEKQQ